MTTTATIRAIAAAHAAAPAIAGPVAIVPMQRSSGAVRLWARAPAMPGAIGAVLVRV